MSVTAKDAWTIIHGMGLGAIFLIAFAGGLAGLYSLRPDWLTTAGVTDRVRRLILGTWVMAVVAWLTVVSGTWVPYVWYRENVPTSPRSMLIADPETALWHRFGMEWKEHIAWLSPILATVVAYLVYYYGMRLVREDKIRRIALVIFNIAFITAAVAGTFGALINKVAPTR